MTQKQRDVRVDGRRKIERDLTWQTRLYESQRDNLQDKGEKLYNATPIDQLDSSIFILVLELQFIASPRPPVPILAVMGIGRDLAGSLSWRLFALLLRELEPARPRDCLTDGLGEETPGGRVPFCSSVRWHSAPPSERRCLFSASIRANGFWQPSQVKGR